MQHPIHITTKTFGKQYAHETNTNETHRYIVTALLDTQPIAQAHAETHQMALQISNQLTRAYNEIDLPLEIAIESYAIIDPARYTQE